MSETTFAAALAQLGVHCAVEAQGKLAVITVARDARPGLSREATDKILDARSRRSIVTLGREHGFTNVCVELGQANASVSGD